MSNPGRGGTGGGERNEMRVSSGDFISWDTWSGRTTTYVVIGNDNHYYDQLWVSLRSADHHDEFHECVPRGAAWATVEEVNDYIDQSRTRWADRRPAVPESAAERWAETLAVRSRDLPPDGRPVVRPHRGDVQVPAGWVAESAGDWNGPESEVVYNPRLYDVMVVPSADTEDREGELAAAGWSYQGTDGFTVLWVRDRAAAARAALDRSSRQPPLEPGGLAR